MTLVLFVVLVLARLDQEQLEEVHLGVSEIYRASETPRLFHNS